MDPHFSEYLAAIAGMNDIYGDHTHDQPTECRDERVSEAMQEPTVVGVA